MTHTWSVGFEEGERRTEVLARRIVEAKLGVPLERADRNIGRSVHDYDIVFPGGEPGALEVFEASVPEDRQRSAEHSRRAGNAFESALLDRCWVVTLGPSAQFKGWAARLEPFLVELEHRGLDRLTIDECYRYRDLLPQCRALDVQIALAFDSAQPRRAIFITTTYGGWSGSPDDGAAELQALLWSKDDVRRKLGASGRQVREAFVVVGFTPYSLQGPLDDGLPTIALALPDEITGAWIARGDGLGWRFDQSAGWAALDPIDGLAEDLPDR